MSRVGGNDGLIPSTYLDVIIELEIYEFIYRNILDIIFNEVSEGNNYVAITYDYYRSKKDIFINYITTKEETDYDWI